MSGIWCISNVSTEGLCSRPPGVGIFRGRMMHPTLRVIITGSQASKEAGARCRCRIAGAGLLARSPWARSRALCRSTMRQSNTTRQDWWMMQRTSFARPSSATNATSLPLYPSQSLSPCSATLFTGQQSRTCHNKVCRSWLARSCFCYARLCIVSHVGEYDADTLISGSGVLAARKRRY